MSSAPFYCSYYTIKSNEKEAENPVFTRDCRHDTGCGKLSIFVGWHRGFTRSFRRFECFWLFDFKTGHEPVELLPGQLLYFQLISGPAEPALDFHTFIQKELFEFLDKCCCTSGLKTETSDGPVPRKKHWRSARTSIKC